MRLDGIHHITGITRDGQRCLDFYAGILGLGFAGRDEDFEAPGSHLIRLAPDQGRPAGVLNFIEAPAIERGRAGDGMIHTLHWTVASPAALRFWAERLSDAGIEVETLEIDGFGPRLAFADPEGIRHELSVQAADAGPVLESPSIPAEHAVRTLAGVSAYGRASVPSADILAGRLGFEVTAVDSYQVNGTHRSSSFGFDLPPSARGRLGTGTVHHIAWAVDGALPAWRQRVIGMGCRATPVIDRGRCRSIYFREPSGVLFEIATLGQEEGERPAASAEDGRLSPRVDPRVHAALVG
jgi:glyoxalase family protein